MICFDKLTIYKDVRRVLAVFRTKGLREEEAQGNSMCAPRSPSVTRIPLSV